MNDVHVPADDGAPSVAIVVVTFGAHGLLDANLADVDLAAADARVVIVDNFHSAEERVAMRAIAEKHGWSFLAMPTNIGYGAAMNHGVKYARRLGCSTFLLLNPDARVDAGVIRELAHACVADPMTLVSPVVLRPDGSTWFRGSYLDDATGNTSGAEPASSAGHTEWLTAACLMVHWDLWRALNGFDSQYFLYWEDIDLSRRCQDLGGRLVVRPDLVAVHDVGGTQEGTHGGTGKSSAYYYFNCRNRLLFASKHLPRGSVMRWILSTPAASKRIVYRGGRRQLVSSPGLLWAAVRGSLAGIAMACSTLLREPERTVHRW